MGRGQRPSRDFTTGNECWVKQSGQRMTNTRRDTVQEHAGNTSTHAVTLQAQTTGEINGQ